MEGPEHKRARPAPMDVVLSVRITAMTDSDKDPERPLALE